MYLHISFRSMISSRFETLCFVLSDQFIITVPLESYDRVPRAHSSHVRVHARVSVNNSVILSTWSSNVSSIIFLNPEGMPRRLSAYFERAGSMTVAARYNVCTDCEGTCERRHRDHKTYCYVSDLQLDEGRWIGRPEQVGGGLLWQTS